MNTLTRTRKTDKSEKIIPPHKLSMIVSGSFFVSAVFGGLGATFLGVPEYIVHKKLTTYEQSDYSHSQKECKLEGYYIGLAAGILFGNKGLKELLKEK